MISKNSVVIEIKIDPINEASIADGLGNYLQGRLRDILNEGSCTSRSISLHRSEYSVDDWINIFEWISDRADGYPIKKNIDGLVS